MVLLKVSDETETPKKQFSAIISLYVQKISMAYCQNVNDALHRTQKIFSICCLSVCETIAVAENIWLAWNFTQMFKWYAKIAT